MQAVDLLGLVAGIFTTTAFFPQVIKTWRSKSAGDISLGMFSIFSVGLLIWLVYGLLIGSAPVIVSNAITFVLAATIIVFKIRYK